MANEFFVRKGLIVSGSTKITGSLEVTADGISENIFGDAPEDTHIFSGSVNVTNGITGSLFGTSSWALTASYAMNADGPGIGGALETLSDVNLNDLIIGDGLAYNGDVWINIPTSSWTVATASLASAVNIISGSLGLEFTRYTGSFSGSLYGTAKAIEIEPGGTFDPSDARYTGSFTGSLTGSVFGTSSYASNADLLDGINSTVFATTGSNTFIGNQIITGSLLMSSSAATELRVIGDTEFTGSLRFLSGGVTGSVFGTSSWAATASNAVTASFVPLVATIGYVIDGGGSAITTGVKGDLVIPFNCRIDEWTLLADQSGSVTIEIWKDTYANYPPTSADSIVASAKPSITSNVKNQSSTLTGWTTTIAANDTLRFNVSSSATITRLTIALDVTRT